MNKPTEDQKRLIASATAAGWGAVHYCTHNQAQYVKGKVFGFRPGLATTMDDNGEEVTWEKIKRHTNTGAQAVRMETQKKEFDAVSELCKRYNALPAIVDDDYPEARHYYESAVRTVIEAFKENGRI